MKRDDHLRPPRYLHLREPPEPTVKVGLRPGGEAALLRVPQGQQGEPDVEEQGGAPPAPLQVREEPGQLGEDPLVPGVPLLCDRAAFRGAGRLRSGRVIRPVPVRDRLIEQPGQPEPDRLRGGSVAVCDLQEGGPDFLRAQLPHRAAPNQRGQVSPDQRVIRAGLAEPSPGHRRADVDTAEGCVLK